MLKAIRLAKFLYAQRIRGFDPPGDEPLMDPPGVERFKRELMRATSYVEFGSGGSTVLADRAGIPSISIESDRFYARVVASRLRGNNVRQIAVDMGLTGEWGSPIFSTPEKARRYVSAPFGSDLFPDFVLVDGRYRMACALETARRANLAGKDVMLMLDDYGGRPHYHEVERHLGAPEMAGRTAIFRVGKQIISQEAVDAALLDKR